MKFSKKSRLLACAATILLGGIAGISGCSSGGGGDGNKAKEAPIPDDPQLLELGVVGDWVSECHFDSDENSYGIAALKLTASGLFEASLTRYGDATCQTNPVQPKTLSGSYSVGQEVSNLSGLAGFPAYELDLLIEGMTFEQLIQPNGNTMHLGLSEDSDTRPTEIDLELTYYRQGGDVDLPDDGNNDQDSGINPLIGSWLTQCEADSDGLSSKLRFRFGPSRDLVVGVVYFQDDSCQAPSLPAFNGTLNETYRIGSQFTTPSGHTAYELDMTLNGDNINTIIGIIGDKGYLGVETGDNYRPDELDFESYLEKE